MANLFDNIFSNLADGIANRIAPLVNDQLGRAYGMLGRYYTGDHRKQLKTREGAKDDNVLLNFVGLAVDRSVSRLFRGGVKWVLPEGAEAQQEYLDKLWELNKKRIILYQLGLHGAVYGTSYFKLIPDGLLDPYTADTYPRLIPLDPEIIRIKTDPQDANMVNEYRIEYTVIEPLPDGFNTREVSYREITRRDRAGDYTDVMRRGYWIVEYYQKVGFGQWTKSQADVIWQYDFPPIIHCKNLPSLKSCYGDSDIDDAINVQDKENFIVSNAGKIVKHHAHPKTIVTGASTADIKRLDDSPESSFYAINKPDVKAANLEMQSDLASSRGLAQDLRQSIFDIAREVDMAGVKDKLGQLTNFGLRVLYTDAIDKNDTKRQLYGDMLRELNRRLLVLAGFDGEASVPGTIQWGEALIVNTLEELNVDKQALDMGIIDKETVAKRYESRYGKTWEDIQKAIADEKASSNANNDNVGATLLRNFMNTNGREVQQNLGNQQPQPVAGRTNA